MDFMSDVLFDGRRNCILAIVKHLTHESLAIEVGWQPRRLAGRGDAATPDAARQKVTDYSYGHRP